MTSEYSPSEPSGKLLIPSSPGSLQVCQDIATCLMLKWTLLTKYFIQNTVKSSAISYLQVRTVLRTINTRTFDVIIYKRNNVILVWNVRVIPLCVVRHGRRPAQAAEDRLPVLHRVDDGVTWSPDDDGHHQHQHHHRHERQQPSVQVVRPTGHPPPSASAGLLRCTITSEPSPAVGSWTLSSTPCPRCSASSW